MNLFRPLAHLRGNRSIDLIKNSVRKFGIANSDCAEKRIKPSCAILTSPKDFNASSGELDENDIEFKDVFEWLKASKYFDTGSSAFQQPTSRNFKTLVDVAFNLLLEPPFCRDSEVSEAVLLYYTGHGVNIKKLDKEIARVTPSSPKLDDIGIPRAKLEPAEKYIEPGRVVKGGEFQLGQGFGFCDLEGLLEPWITALSRLPTPKNKHLIVIADGCFSGMLVKDLQKLALENGPWNQNGCSVTVQSACRSDEVNFVSYFTSCFVHFNKPENRGILEELKRKWNSKSEIRKNGFRYRHLYLPSPQVATTMQLDKLSSNIDCPTIEFQDLPLTLFHDPGFFKFCFKKYSKMKIDSVFTLDEATKFLSQRKFEIVDFKLKITWHCTPLALFLVRSSEVPGRFVRVQIHFKPRGTSLDHVTQVNLTSYNVPNENHLKILSNVVFEDTISTKREVKIRDSNTERLVKECKACVEKTKYKWSKISDWNMTDSYTRKEAAWMIK